LRVAKSGDPTRCTIRARKFGPSGLIQSAIPKSSEAVQALMMRAGITVQVTPDDRYRRTAYFVDRIFKGTKPADLPVEQAAKFDMVLNLRTAKAIGLTIPDSVLLLADEVIE
jgi:putative tryptophan/tyrosine transport system substrate-binding protein